MSWVHDNIIASYLVDFANERLLLKTQYYDESEICENIDVIFEGYWAHRFEHEQPGSIIFDIEECAPARFYESEHELFEKNRNHCWPIAYQTPDTRTELMKFMRDNGYKVFEILSSLGLCGWVISQRMEIVVSEAARPPAGP
ncbi:MAG: hypothetical protein LBV79_00250 [Candidatus Adiutrix sp.]|jgi:hypothetical protein|nr:hypothetical protein [Candidatus Adiutrix sp.]